MSPDIRRGLSFNPWENRVYEGLLITSGFLDRQEATQTISNIRDLGNWESVSKVLNKNVLSNLATLIPANSRKAFLTGTDASFVIRTLDEELFNEQDRDEKPRYTEHDIARIVSRSTVNPSENLSLFLRICHDEEFFNWVTPYWNSLVGLFLADDRRNRLGELFKVPKKERDPFIESISFSDFNAILDQRKRPLNVRFLLENPFETNILARHLRVFREPEAWSSRLPLLYEYLLYKSEMQADDSEVDKLILAQYKGPRHVSDWELVARLRNQTVKPELIRKARVYISKRDGVLEKPDLIEKFRLNIEKRRIRILENPINCLSHLKAKVGFEVEQQKGWQFPTSLFSFLDCIGIKQGLGGIELSPGPFRDSETAILTFLLLAKSGAIDSYHLGAGIHFNIGVEGYDGINEFTRLFQATSWASDLYLGKYPFDPRIGKHKLRTNHNDNDDGIYREIKEFMLLNPSGFVSQIRYGTSLATALMSYQKILMTKLTDNKDISNYCFTNVLIGPKLPSKIEKGAFTQDEIQLAGVWIDLNRKLYGGFKQVGLDKVLAPDPDIKYARHLASLVSAVFPDTWSRYYVNPGKAPGAPIEIDGKRYPNVVCFARSLCREAHNNVQKILSRAEYDFLSMMRAAKSTNNVVRRNVTIGKIFDRFPCGLEKDATLKAKLERFKELLDLYEI